MEIHLFKHLVSIGIRNIRKIKCVISNNYKVHSLQLIDLRFLRLHHGFDLVKDQVNFLKKLQI